MRKCSRFSSAWIASTETPAAGSAWRFAKKLLSGMKARFGWSQKLVKAPLFISLYRCGLKSSLPSAMARRPLPRTIYAQNRFVSQGCHSFRRRGREIGAAEGEREQYRILVKVHIPFHDRGRSDEPAARRLHETEAKSRITALSGGFIHR